MAKTEGNKKCTVDSAQDLLEWLKIERNILLNSGQMMWHKPNEQGDTLKMAEHLDKTIKYIEIAKESNFNLD